MVEYRNSNKYQSSISDSRINFHCEVKENEFSQTFKLAKESLIISKLELKFEKMKKDKRKKLKEKIGDEFDNIDDDHELNHNLPNESLRANKTQLFTNYSQHSTEHEVKIDVTPTQSEVAKPRRLKLKTPKSTNMDSSLKNTTESSVNIAEKTVNTENNTGFNQNYKLEELMPSPCKDKSKSKFKQDGKTDYHRKSNFKSDISKEEKLRNGVKFVDIPNEQKEKKINLYLQSNLASNNTSHNTSSKSINSNNCHVNNQETKHTSNTNSNTGLLGTILDNKSKKEAVKINSNKTVLPNVPLNQDHEEKELKRHAHVRKRSTSCFAFLCG
jgi:hypothetical protein